MCAGVECRVARFIREPQHAERLRAAFDDGPRVGLAIDEEVFVLRIVRGGDARGSCEERSDEPRSLHASRCIGVRRHCQLAAVSELTLSTLLAILDGNCNRHSCGWRLSFDEPGEQLDGIEDDARRVDIVRTLGHCFNQLCFFRGAYIR